MSKKVFANGSEIAGKASSVKVIAAFPDVCKSPPAPPSGPLMVPYANSSRAADLRAGSKSVKIGGQPIALQQQSFFKTAPLGNEAATGSFGGGLASAQTSGKTYFAMWSMDVRAESLCVCRHGDLTTSNHGSNANTGPQTALGEMAPPGAGTGGADKPKCECCGQDMHESQMVDGKPGPVVTEEQWYCIGKEEEDDIARALDELAKGWPHPQNKTAMKRAEQQLTALAERDSQMRNRRAVIAMGKEMGCKCLPEPPCDVYRAMPEGAKKKAVDVWKRESQAYREAHGFPPGATSHRVPKSAGGCPGSRDDTGNLAHDSELGPDCMEYDHGILTDAHDECAKIWAKRLDDGWKGFA